MITQVIITQVMISLPYLGLYSAFFLGMQLLWFLLPSTLPAYSLGWQHYSGHSWGQGVGAGSRQ